MLPGEWNNSSMLAMPAKPVGMDTTAWKAAVAALPDDGERETGTGSPVGTVHEPIVWYPENCPVVDTTYMSICFAPEKLVVNVRGKVTVRVLPAPSAVAVVTVRAHCELDRGVPVPWLLGPAPKPA